MQYIVLEKDQLLDMHMLMVERYGGRMGLISNDVLLQVVETPQQVYFGQLRFVTPLQQIAAVVYALVRRQPFVSQNETTALLVLMYLCDQQGYRLLVPHRDIVTAIVNIHSDSDESLFYRWLHANVTVDDNSVN
ncbi:MAG: Fic family protein [Roseiflexaceae bacterium]